MISKSGGLLGAQAARFSAEIDAELFNRAEKELAAFVAACSALYGEERARAAADDWLRELIALKGPCKRASLDLRSLTIGAARRLARRLSTPSPAHAALASVVSILLFAAPANAHAAHSICRHPVIQEKLATLDMTRCRSVCGKHELNKIPTIHAKTRTTAYPMCSLLTVSEPSPSKSGTQQNQVQEPRSK